MIKFVFHCTEIFRFNYSMYLKGKNVTHYQHTNLLCLRLQDLIWFKIFKKNLSKGKHSTHYSCIVHCYCKQYIFQVQGFKSALRFICSLNNRFRIFKNTLQWRKIHKHSCKLNYCIVNTTVSIMVQVYFKFYLKFSDFFAKSCLVLKY